MAFDSLRNGSEQIHSFHDWHEHDGFVVASQVTSWPHIYSLLESDYTLYKSRGQDYAVRIAIYAGNYDWLIRYNIDDEDEANYSSSIGDFDICASPQTVADHMLSRLATEFSDWLIRSPAQLWFMGNYGG